MSDIEEEVILLRAVSELIDSIVNLEVLTIQGADPDASIVFRTRTHQKFFNIVLGDLLSCTDRKACIKQTSYLGALRSIAADPRFDSAGSVTFLRDSTHAFVNWLEQVVEVDTWFPSINKQTVLKIERVGFLKMCGDISKHNFLRAVGVAGELQQHLGKSGVVITLDDALLALADFYDRFHRDILTYHGSTLVEFLNNIRWGIHEYVQPEFHRSIVWESHDPPKYRYTHPTGVTSNFARQCYWELMNDMRTTPYIRRFKTTSHLRLRY